MDLSPLSSKKTTTGELLVLLTREEELRKGLLVFFVLLTADSALLMYLLWGDLVFGASVVMTYVALGLLLGRRFGCLEPTTEGGRRCQEYTICFLFLLLAVLEVCTLAPRAASSTSAPMLVAAAGAAALGAGGVCAYWLHRRSWSKQQRQEAIFLPLRQDPRS